MTRQSSVYVWVAVGLLGALSGRTAAAQDVSDLEGLLSEQIVSTASKHSEGASSAPALSTNLTAEDLRMYGIRTLAEAMDFLGIAVASSDNSSGGEVGARGVLLTGDRGSHFLLLVDGQVLNDPLRGGTTFGPGAGIPIELVDHIEIIVGPGSVLYGSNAMFGIVNVVTKRAKNYSGVHVISESALPTSIRVGAGAGAEFKLFGAPTEITTQLEYFKQAGPDLFFAAENTGVDRFTGQPGRNSRSGAADGIWGGRRATHSSYADSPSGILRIVRGNTELHLQGAYYLHASPAGTGNFDDRDSAERETRAIASLKHRIVVSTLLELSARAYGSYYSMRNDFIASRGELCPFGNANCDFRSAGTAHWLGLELQSSWDWFRDGHFSTILGADARQRGVSTTTDAFDTASGRSFYRAAPGLARSDATLAAYAEQRFLPTESVVINGGARVDSDSRFGAVVTPRLATSWKAWEGGTLKASYAGAFRAPSWDEANNETSRRILADGLRPEKVQSVEVSVNQRVRTHRLIIGGFYSKWTDLVELATLSDQETISAIRNGKTTVPFTPGVHLTQYRNTSTVFNYGVNTGVEGSFASEHLLYGFTITGAIADRRTAQGSSRLPVAAQLFGNARVAWVIGDPLPTVGLGAHVVGPRPADLSSGFSPPPFAAGAAELRLTLSGKAPLVDGLSYRLIANYNTARNGAYVVGPVTSALPTQPNAELNPIDRFRIIVGVQYDF